NGYIIGCGGAYTLVKTDSLGNLLWAKSPRNATPKSIEKCYDGGYVFLSEGDCTLIKTNMFGDTIWSEQYGYWPPGNGYWVEQTADSGFIISGDIDTDFPDEYESRLMKTDSIGTIIWDKIYGGSDDWHSCEYVEQTFDGGYILTGRLIYVNGENSNLVKTNSQGDTVWTRSLPLLTTFECVHQTLDGGYIIQGEAAGDPYILKTDTAGFPEWGKYVNISYIHSFQITSDGGYIMTGASQNVWILKADTKGDIIWDRYYGGIYSDGGYSIHQTSDGGYIVAGFTRSFGVEGMANLYLIKTDSLGHVTGIEETDDINYIGTPKIEAFPNPFLDHLSICNTNKQADIYDIRGRLIGKTDKGMWNGRDVKGEEVRSGIYFLQVKGYEPTKVVKLQ
ncbi:T9SS type A sorting domain-containing protein, partial [candidate division WOR-3 bacterium]|nr:T9SS type A sorting domain-containing protein [candidate division WOR-3 bacterium]